MADNSTRIVITAEDKTRQAFESVRAGLDGVGRSASTIAATVAGMAGLGGILSGVGISAMVKESIDAADAMNDLSQRIGIAVQDLAKYELAAQQSGTSMEAIARGVKGLAGSMLEHGDALKKAGITAKDADGAMRQLADLFARMPDGMEKTVLATKLFGKAGMDLIPMLNMGSKGLDESAQKSERYAASMALLAPQADKFNDHMAELAISGKLVGMTLANEVVPKLIDISAAMAIAARESGVLTAGLVGLGGVMSPLGVLYKGFMNDIDEANLKLLKFFNAGEKDGSRKKLESDIARRNQDILSLIPQDVNTSASSVASKTAALSKESSEQIKASVKAAKALLEELLKGKGAVKAVADEFAAVMNRVNAKDSGVDASFWKDLQTLHAGFKAGEYGEDVDAYAKAVRNLTNQQGFAKDAAKAAAEVEETIWKAREKAREEAERSLATLQGEIKQQQRHNEEIGLTAEAFAQLTDRRMLDAIATKEQEFAKRQAEGADLAELKLIDEQIGALEKLRQLKSDGAARQAVADSAKQAADEWKRFSDDIERALTDSLMRGFENGESFGKNFVKSLQNTLKTTVLKMAVQAVVSPVMGGVGQMMGVPGAGGSSTGGFGSAFSGGGGFSFAGSPFTDVYSRFATSKMGETIGLSNSIGTDIYGDAVRVFGDAGASLNSAAQALDTYGGYIGAAVSAANGNYGAAAGQAIGAYFGGPVGAWIGGEIGDKVFGDTVVGRLIGEPGGPQSGQYGTLTSKGYSSQYTMSGGDNLGNQKLAETAYAQVSSLYQLAGKKVGDLVLEQGYKLDPEGGAAGVAFRNITVDGKDLTGGTFDGNNGGQWYGAKDDAEGAANYLGKLGTSEIMALVDAIDDPTFSATVAKLAANFTDLNDGLTKYTVAQTQQKALATAMMTDAEKLAQVTTDMNAGFAALGIAVPDSTAAFRELVQGLDITTQAGMDQLTGLDKLGQSFLDVQNAAAMATGEIEAVGRSLADIASERTSLQDQLDNLTMTSVQLLAKQRNAIDASNRTLFDQVQSATLAKTAAEDFATAVKDAADAMTAATKSASEAAAQSVIDTNTKRLEAVTTGAASGFDALTRAITAQKTAMQTGKVSLDSVTSSIGKLQSLSNSLKSTLDGMRISGSDSAYRADAQAQIRAALAVARAGGGLPLDGQLDSALKTVSQPSEQLFTSFTDYARDFYGTANDIAALGDLTGAQLTAEKLLQNTLKNGMDDQTSALDDILTNAKLQLDAANGLNVSVLSVADALTQFDALVLSLTAERNKQSMPTAAAGYSAAQLTGAAAANAAATPNTGIEKWLDAGNGSQTWASGAGAIGYNPGSGEGSITGVNGKIVSFAEAISFVNANVASGDLMSIYTTAKDYGVSLKSLDQLMGWADNTAEDWAKKQGLPTFAVGTNYVPYDMVAKIHEGEAIVPRAYNPAAGGSGNNNAELAASLRAMADRLDKIEANTRATAGHTAGTDRKLARVIPGNAVITQAAI